MLELVIKATISGIIIAVVSEVARRSPGIGAIITALPLIAVGSMIWLWRDGAGAKEIADYAKATFWYVLPSLPMFLLIPALLKRGVGFWPALAVAALLTLVLFVTTSRLLEQLGSNKL